MMFDAMLLWQPWRPMNKRIPTRPSTQHLPTWSWMSWQGSTHTESWRSAYGYIRKNVDEFRGERGWYPFTWSTFPTLEWSWSKSPTSPRQKISQHLVPDNYLKDDDSLLPNGWTKFKYDVNKRPAFKHETHPDQTFWYPISLSHSRVQSPSVSRWPYLHCKTRQAIFRFGTMFKPSASICYAVNILDQDGNWAGVLRLNIEISNINIDMNEAGMPELWSHRALTRICARRATGERSL
jgi:hypothetical protein